MVTAQEAASYVAIIVSLVSLGGTAFRVKGKWDTTNALLGSIVREVRGNEEAHTRTHQRMDAFAERTEARLTDHIGKHRRL